MSCFFIDITGFVDNDGDLIIKEICIMNIQNILQPLYLICKNMPDWNSLSLLSKQRNEDMSNLNLHLTWDEGNDVFCSFCLSHSILVKSEIFYVMDDNDGRKLKTLKSLFPKWRFANYSLNANSHCQLPTNISCPWREHGPNCAYKHCLLGAIDYLNVK